MPKKCANWGMNTTAKLLFSQKEILHEEFLRTDLGQLYFAIPFESLASKIPPPQHSIGGMGRKPWFDIKGGIGLQFLKHYLGLSDEKLVERINTDWSMQLFCGICLKPGQRIKDKDIVGKWRKYLGDCLNIDELQKIFAEHWKPLMSHTNIGSQDATCYESGIRYPTDSKLLWECCEFVFKVIQQQRNLLNLRKSRCDIHKRRKMYLEYARMRKKSKRKEKVLCKKLLKFLLKLMNLLNNLSDKNKFSISMRSAKKLKVIEKVYNQQHQRLYGKKGEKIKERIVSIYKPYVRPIIRGKETKPVEFGAKVNKLQVDGISFIDRLSFDAFNETTCFGRGIFLQRKLFGKCTHQSADAIYATNKNRTYAKSQGITTNFIAKGRQKVEYIEQAQQMRNILNKQRSTVLEGSFGNEKNHFLLSKSRARTKPTDIAWIFFGMMTANASIIAKRMQIQQHKARAA